MRAPGLTAPLISGTALRPVDDATLKVILNHEVIAADQDPLGIQGEFGATVFKFSAP
jgi:hypothetical protein